MHEDVFSSIYATAYWGRNADGEGYSGPGSIPENCAEYTALLQQFLKERNITSVVDAGCGDWQFSQLIDWGGIKYVGYDVVEHLIKRNNTLFGSEAISFVKANFLKTDLPKADLFLCKDVFQHLTHADILAFLPMLKQFKYCLITNHVDSLSLSSDNHDIRLGDFRLIDLSKPPFNMQGQLLFKYIFF
jgi:hypothetical protein